MTYKTVGHTGADYICNGTNDTAQLQACLDDGYDAKIIGDGTAYNMSAQIWWPGDRTVTAYDPAAPPILKATVNGIVFRAVNVAATVSYLKFDGNGKACKFIIFETLKDTTVEHNEIYGILGTGWDSDGTAISIINGRATVDAHNLYVKYNVVRNCVGVAIYIHGDIDPLNRGAYCDISYNNVKNCWHNPYALSGIDARYANVHHNVITSFGPKVFAYGSGPGCGIGAARSTIAFNVVRGCGGESGIVPTCAHPSPYVNPVNPECQNDSYCLVDRNIVEYNGANGIDFWYSDGSIITNNRCNDNGQMCEEPSWDENGIDCSNHTQNCVVNNNECCNRASSIRDTITAGVAVGAAYVTVTNISKWYDIRNGYIAPFEGLTITIGGKLNRIDWIDVANNRLYLVGGMKVGSAIAGDIIVGVNRQLAGINLTDNGQSYDPPALNIIGSGNLCTGNLLTQIGALGGNLLPHAVVTAGGPGIILPIDGPTLPFNIVCEGDSRTWHDIWPPELVSLLGGGAIRQNVALSGERIIEDMLQDGVTEVDSKYDALKTNVAILWGGVNDLANNPSRTAAEVHTAIQTWALARRAAGFVVIVTTELPISYGMTGQNDDPSYETRRQELNALLRTNYGSYANGIADLGADATIGLRHSETNTTYYSDRLHMTTAGYVIVGGIMYHAILSWALSGLSLAGLRTSMVVC